LIFQYNMIKGKEQGVSISITCERAINIRESF
jgi:hypothetical protein